MKTVKTGDINMKRLEIKLFIDIDEKQTNADDVIFHLDTAIDEEINGVSNG
mgnify:CR=1 FL=1